MYAGDEYWTKHSFLFFFNLRHADSDSWSILHAFVFITLCKKNGLACSKMQLFYEWVQILVKCVLWVDACWNHSFSSHLQAHRHWTNYNQGRGLSMQRSYKGSCSVNAKLGLIVQGAEAGSLSLWPLWDTIVESLSKRPFSSHFPDDASEMSAQYLKFFPKTIDWEIGKLKRKRLEKWGWLEIPTISQPLSLIAC